MDHSVPQHLGLILDGNRRWAKSQGIQTLEGHKKGYDNLKVIAAEAFESGVKYVSAYIFSTENWNRSREEVGYLMNLIVTMANKDLDSLIEKDVRIVFLGTREKLPKSIVRAVEGAEQRSKDNRGGTLALCFNYGGQLEIVDAVKKVITDGVDAADVDQEMIESHLYQSDIPPVDFMIRTSGEQRISNFMLWRMAYAELYFVDKHWPAFTVEDLDKAFKEYASRQRRFGK